MEIKIERIYEHQPTPGYRVLVDRLWPRGISKITAQLDDWAKEIAPSKELRTWFNHDPEKFAKFSDRYITELTENEKTSDFISLVSEHLKNQNVIFLYGAKDVEHNQAVVLKRFVENQLNA